MPLQYTILRDVGLVYVRYWGLASVQETVEVFQAFTEDPAFRPDLKHLVDLKDLVDYERAYADLIKFQALQADSIADRSRPTHMVYFAPTPIGMSMARAALKSWEGLGALIGGVAQDETEALEMLGLGQRSIADLPMDRA